MLKAIIHLFVFALFMLPAHGNAADIDTEIMCNTYFPDAVVTHSRDGLVEFKWEAHITNDSDGVITTARTSSEVSDERWHDNNKRSCNEVNCQASGNSATKYNSVGDFPKIKSKKNLNIPSNAEQEIKLQTKYNRISVGNNATLTVSNNSHVSRVYKMKELRLNDQSTINLIPGDYWIKNLNMGTEVTINIVGDGDVRLFIETTSNGLPSKSEVNQANNSSMLLYFYSDVTTGGEVKSHAFIYSKGKLIVGSSSVLKGAISGQNVSLASNTEITYACSAESEPEPEPIVLPDDLCTAYFVDGITSHTAGGTITLPFGSRVFDSPDAILDAPNVINQSINAFQLFYDESCDTVSCSASGSATEKLAFGDFRSTSSSINWLEKGKNKIIGNNDEGNEYNSVTIQTGKPASFDAQHSQYKIGDLTINSSSTLTFTAGEYWIDELNLGSASTLIIAEHAYIFINQKIVIPSNTQIQTVSGNSESLLFYGYSEMDIQTINPILGLIYSKSDIEIGVDTIINGSVSGQNTLLDNEVGRSFGIPTYTSEAKISYDCENTSIDPPPNMFLIEHDGSGLTCANEDIRIKACSDDQCTSFDTSFDATNVTLTLDGRDDISIGIGSNGQSNNAYFNYTNAGSVALGLNGMTPVCKNTSTGDKNSSSACNTVFADSGFLVNFDQDHSCGSQTVSIQAVKKDDDSAQCVGALTGTKNVFLQLEYDLPSTGTKQASFSNNGNSHTLTTSSVTYPLDFDSDSKASLTNFSYPDAGRITIKANYTETSGDLNDLSLEGEDSETIYPFKFAVTATKADGTFLHGGDHNASVIHPAGDAFTLNVSAQCNDGTNTPNYVPINDTSLEVAVERIAPTTNGVDGVLSAFDKSLNSSLTVSNWKAVAQSDVNNGVASDTDASFSEVGIIKVYARDTQYANIPITGNSSTTGRFTPAYFEQTVIDHGQLTSGCNAFAYIGQENLTKPDFSTHEGIVFGPAPDLQITSKNRLGKITQNYIGDYRKLTDIDIFNAVISPTQDETTTGVDGNKLALNSVMNSGVIAELDDSNPSGQFKYIFNVSDNFVYQRSTNSMVVPFNSDILISLGTFSDSDGVSSLMTEDVRPAGIDVKFARMVVKDSFGIEGQRLEQQLQLETYNGSGFERHNVDSCTPFDVSQLQINSGSLHKDNYQIEDNSAMDILLNGMARSAGVVSSPSKPTGQGTLNIEYQAPSFFLYNWGSGNLTDNPSGVATYGIFNRPSKRIISEQEVIN